MAKWDDCDAQEVKDISDDIKDEDIEIITIGVGFSNLASVECSDKAKVLLGEVTSHPSWFLSLEDFTDLDELLESLQ
jgi:hypothetical protein